MEWLTLIVIAVVLAALLGKSPSAVHDPAGYKGHQGCKTILGILFLIGVVMGLVKGCHRTQA
jgi:hypothetical protein